MIEKLIALDKKIFLFLNSFHTPWLDVVMYQASETITWIPLYIILFIFIFKHYKKDSWMVLLLIILTIVLADQTTSTFMKPYFARLRPSHEPTLKHLVHTVNGYIGRPYGFASSHAANTFGVATFLFYLFAKYQRWMAWLFLWAILVTFSRVYLGVHYPGDIVVGGAVGAFWGWICYTIFPWLYKRFQNQVTPKHF